MNHSSSSRRDFLQKGATLAAGTLLGSVGWDGVSGSGSRAIAAEHGGAGSTQRKRVLRIAHLTDVHVQPERAADQGLIACLHHVQQLDEKPDIIFNGGDAVMDSLAVGGDRVGRLWKLWNETLRQECSLPVESCIGNHDVFGWNRKKSGATGDEPRYGKAWALEALGLARPYRSFDRAGWHFVVLDSIYNSGHDSQEPGQHDVYEARLDDEQFAWLAEDLKNNDPNLPVCVLSHIPILSACAYFDGRNEKTGEWRVPASFMHIDARRIKNLFLEHPNIRLCLSGHIHLLDRVDYDGVSYLCNGAVSGNWWKGKYQECDAGYALVDLFDDGSFEQRYLEYGWKAREA